MSRTIKLHWAQSKPNFGDWLSPLVCELVSGKQVVYAKITHCDLVAVGSLLGRLKERPWTRRVNVWGTGSITESKPHKSRHTYHAVRGSFSAEQITNASITTLGDPGLLADQLINPGQIEKRYDVGIVPHYKDHDHPVTARLQNTLKRATTIDVLAPPKEVITRIAQCRTILSSSLHGLITADSLDIPNRRIQISENIRGGDWKFDDYYSCFGIRPEKLLAERIVSSDLGSAFDQFERPGIEQVKEDLYRAFPSF
jgi:hypothetical protein